MLSEDGAVETETPRRRRRPVALAVIVAAGLLAGVGLLGALTQPATTRDARTATLPVPLGPPTHGVFSTPTGLTLVVDEGNDGLVALDLDRGLARRFTYPGKTEGTRLTQVGDRLVFSTADRPESVPLNLAGVPEPIGVEPTGVFVPAGETDRAWLVYDTPAGGRAEQVSLGVGSAAGASTITWSSGVAVVAGRTDRVLTVPSTPGEPPGESRPRWLVAGRSVPEPVAGASSCVPPVAQRAATIVVGAGSPACNGVQRLGPSGVVGPTVSIPEVALVVPRAISPAGDKVVVAGVDPQGAGGHWLVDFVTGKGHRIDELPDPSSSIVTWSTDGLRLFTLSSRDGQTWLSLYDSRSDRYEARSLPVGPVKGATPALHFQSVGMIALPSGSGPDLAATSSDCVAPVTGPGDADPLPAIQGTTCRLPDASSPARGPSPGPPGVPTGR